MSPRKKQTPVPGSERAEMSGARLLGPADPASRLEITVRLRPNPSGAGLPSPEALGAALPQERTYLSREELAAAQGADPADLEKIAAFARNNSLQVVDSIAARRSVVLAGTVQVLSKAFGVKLGQYEYPGGSYIGRTGALHVPAAIAAIVEGVFGLDNRPQAQPHIVLPPNWRITRASIPAISYTPIQVGELYNFPAGLDGKGQCIGILEFGGGYNNRYLKAYFQELGIPAPEVTAVPVDGQMNRAGVNPDMDGEVMLDIEIAGAIAPAAKIVVYFAPFTERGWVDALTTAVHDNQNKPSVISISWGFAEGKSIWTGQAVRAVDQTLQAAAAIGVTVLCASGDDGSNDQVDDHLAHVDFPASSPFILACGGTRLRSAAKKIKSETVWNHGPRNAQGGGATGGGISAVFAMPAWQSGIVPPSANPGHNSGRGVPDAAGNADPETGYTIFMKSHDIHGVGGTSAVAPLFAGLVARINQGLGLQVGYFNPLLYSTLAKGGICRDVKSGNNGAYRAQNGWDACTGWGSFNGQKLMDALGGKTGAHQTSAHQTGQP